MSSAADAFTFGKVAELNSENIRDAIIAAVDYRGDLTLKLKNGSDVTGYIYNYDGYKVDLLVAGSALPQSCSVADIVAINFSGADTARGKSWDEWQTKNAAERAEIKAAPIENE